MEQVILAEFIREGHFARHLRRMRMLYQERQRIVLEAASAHLNGLLDVQSSDAGMHLVGWLPEGMNDQLASVQAARDNIIAHPISDYIMQHPIRPGLLLGYTSFHETQIRAGIEKLANALRTL